MWAGNNVYGFYFTDVTRSYGTCVCCRFYRPDITTNDDGHQPGTYFFVADQQNICRLHHGVRGLYGGS